MTLSRFKTTFTSFLFRNVSIEFNFVLSFSVLNSHVGNEVKMAPDFERYEHQVEDMYNILLNISSELLTIKTMMKLLEDIVDNDTGVVDVNDVFQRLTLDTIGQCALAMNVNCQVDREDNFLKMIRAALDR